MGDTKISSPEPSSMFKKRALFTLVMTFFTWQDWAYMDRMMFSSSKPVREINASALSRPSS